MNFAIVLVLALLLSAPAIAAETAAIFAKSVITEPGLHPWTIVTVPDECLVVELRLDPFVAKQSDLKSEFGTIVRSVVPAALDKFTKLKSVQLTGLVTARDSRVRNYLSQPQDCRACTLKQQCTRAPFKKIARDINEDARNQARSLKGTPEFERSGNARKKVEMRFAHLKVQHGFERMRLRGLTGARDEFHLAAIVQNLKTMAVRLVGPPTRGACRAIG